MKRTIVIEILLLFTVIVHLTLGIWCIKVSYLNFQHIHGVPAEIASDLLSGAYKYLIRGIFALLAALATLAAMILIALKDFPVFKPMLDKLAAKRDMRKQAKAEKAVADKQARIERLQSELDELKKDE